MLLAGEREERVKLAEVVRNEEAHEVAFYFIAARWMWMDGWMDGWDGWDGMGWIVVGVKATIED
jgi:hypothetical protein